MEITQARLKELLHYDPETGVFTWAIARRKCRKGHIAGTMNGNGYVRIIIDRKKHYAHRLAWLYVTGKLPDDQIDHVNMDKSDNRFCNLREATCQQNNVNKNARTATGSKGVVRVGNKYRAMIWSGGTTMHLGYFDTELEAREAYAQKANELHGEYARC